MFHAFPVLLALLAGACVQPEHPTNQALETDSVEVPFKLVRTRIVVPVAVNGQGPFDFMVDIGASGMGRLDDSLRAALGIPVVAQGNNFDGVNTSTIDVVKVERLALGPLIQRDVELLSRDYRHHGILGREYFAQHLLTLDYPNRVLRLTDGALNAADAHVLAYDRPFHVPVRIGRVETEANLDTGSSLTMHLPMAYADRLETTELVEAGIGRRANTTFQLYRATLLEPIMLAGNTVRDVEVVFSAQAPGINIGSALLQRFALTIDQRNQRIRIVRPDGSD